MNKISCALIALCITTGIRAQINGVVYGSDRIKKETIVGAKVKLLNAKTGATTGEDGTFKLILPKELPDTLLISAFGYYNDTIIVTKKDRFSAFEIVLYSDQLLEEVVVSVKRETHSISRLKVLHVEELGSGELRKAACCNLSESFETNASVDVNITDAVSGAKKIQMMGLDGVYTQIQYESVPALRGLESSFGLNSMPGTWVESIQITKGTGNVVNGYESMAGLVNIELKKPHEMEKIFLNGYVNRFGRAELNFNSGFHLSEKWTSAWFAHASTTPLVTDENRDGFRDFPNGSNLAVMNRYNFAGKKMEAQISMNAYWDNKIGGQNDFRRAGDGFYGMTLDSRHVDVVAKTGFFLKKPLHSIGVIYNAKYQTTDALFGLRTFKGEEKRGYVNVIYDGIINNSTHKFKLGASTVVSDLKQQQDSLNDDRFELVPGVFGEYTYTGARLSAVFGARADYHNLFKEQFSPRAHLKYSLSEYTDVRATIGRGWRVPNYMIDQISLLATSRTWVAPDTTMPEVSWNVGGSIVQRFKLGKRNGNITFDYYYTSFENQLIVDRDLDPTKIIFTNLVGKSFSNSFQTELSISPFDRFEARFAYKFLDVRADFGGLLQQKVMIPNHRGFMNLAYQTRNKRWEYDLTCSVFGKSRLPVNVLEDGSLTTENTSQAFPLVNAQITHTYKRWEFYIGGENLLNYTQKKPIIDAQNPFGQTFDATRVWAPVMGTNIYAGFRFALKQAHKD